LGRRNVDPGLGLELDGVGGDLGQKGKAGVKGEGSGGLLEVEGVMKRKECWGQRGKPIDLD
jgi:hypothetical protein